ncbi:IclR family transcriptional regulator [Megasphaera paucivorans]|uniref:Transcriptional regulator, IclR family n=1 Tax=Megasphaera paucivorans TaxID=349095 RepID=A0A1H0B8Q3_9FIRM|nr:IclR family transcriptional regulator [Megasphaera paucivorans]SDN42037.1 transcriptional regulator, IclR family [Megasphaera paucivorans]
MAEKKDRKYILQSVENALSILDLLCEHQELSVNEVAKYMGLGKSTAFRLLTTLCYKNFVVKDDKAYYSLSVKFAGIWKIISDRSMLIQQIHPFLVNLSAKTGETSHLVIWNSDSEIIFIDKVIAPATIRMDSMVGLTRLAHTTGTGKVLLANSTQLFINQYLSTTPFIKMTPYTISSKETLLSELENVRQQGYSCDNEESEVGLTCFSVPIFSMNKAIAAISTSGPTHRMNTKKEMLIQSLKSIAKNIEISI